MAARADRELVELARRGDGGAAGELFSKYWRGARAAAFGVTGKMASAEDAAAEAFIQALSVLHSLRDPDRFAPWLRTIVVRKARLQIQGRNVGVNAPTGELLDPRESPEAALERLELAALIQQAVRELPCRSREAVALVYFEGYDAQAAAAFLNIPEGTLRRRLHDGRERLRRAVEQLLLGHGKMSERREEQIQRYRRLIDEGAVYEGFQGALALRPPPRDLIALIRRMARVASGSTVLSPEELIHRFVGPSERALDPNHPVGSVAVAIKEALPEFQEWRLDAREAGTCFLTFRPVLPPGFAKGRPGAFLRATRALVHASVGGAMRSVYQLVQDSPDEAAFRTAASGLRISDVIDLTWMAQGVLELRSVHKILESLVLAVLPRVRFDFLGYDEPRYRSALQLRVVGMPMRFACGGVLVGWPGQPEGLGTAHIRIFLEPWASIRTGRAVDFDTLPAMPLIGVADCNAGKESP